MLLLLQAGKFSISNNHLYFWPKIDLDVNFLILLKKNIHLLHDTSTEESHPSTISKRMRQILFYFIGQFPQR